jgi:hypothetical protein
MEITEIPGVALIATETTVIDGKSIEVRVEMQTGTLEDAAGLKRRDTNVVIEFWDGDTLVDPEMTKELTKLVNKMKRAVKPTNELLRKYTNIRKGGLYMIMEELLGYEDSEV